MAKDERDNRGYGPERDERDLGERLADEVRSWFGDEDAAVRRGGDATERGRGRPGFGHPRHDWGVRDYNRYEASRYPGHFRGTDPERDWDRYDYDAHANSFWPGGVGWAGGPWGAYYAYGGPLLGRERDRYGGAGEHSDWYQGQHVGRGPKDYQRSPERIREDAHEALTWHGGVDASDIVVKVEGDEITLEGTVDSRRGKRMAEDAVERVRGVRDVHNRLRIKPTQDQQKPGK